MREFVLNPDGGPDTIALYIGSMPGRKRIHLAIREGSAIRTVASFTHDDDALEVAELLARMLTICATRRIDGLTDG